MNGREPGRLADQGRVDPCADLGFGLRGPGVIPDRIRPALGDPEPRAPGLFEELPERPSLAQPEQGRGGGDAEFTP